MNNAYLAKPERKDAEMTNKQKYKELCENVCSYENLKKAYEKAIKGNKKYKSEAINFGMCAEYNLVNLWRSVKNDEYVVGLYNQFYVHEPKQRLISAPRFRDKVVQFAMHDVLEIVYEDVFIKDSYACRKGKGSHRAANKVQHYMRLCKWKHGGGWIVALDVEKFFYSIIRELLKEIVAEKLPFPTFLNILYKIIDSSPEGDVGIPLGCVTSQDLSGIYMAKLDNYCKRYLGIKWYVRYADDVICVVETKEQAQKLKSDMVWYLKEHLQLDTNDKTQIYPLDQGVNAYGYKIWTTHMLVRNQSKRKMKRRIKSMDAKLQDGKLELGYVQQCANSWLGHARHSNSYNLCKKIFKNYPYIQVDNNKTKFGEMNNY